MARLSLHLSEMSKGTSEVVAVKDGNFKMYHAMSAKQTLREDLAEHSYQFSCRAAEWSATPFASVPTQFEPIELHVADASGQQDVPENFQQPAKTITEEASVTRRPQAEAWRQAVLEEIASFRKLSV